MLNENVQNFLHVIHGRKPERVPVALFGGSPFSLALSHVSSEDYYFHPDTKLKVFENMFATFPDILFLPGYWPDFGSVDIPSAFGSPIVWSAIGNSPHAEPAISSVKDIARFVVPDVYTSGYGREIFSQWQYFWRYGDKKWREEYGYLDGAGWSTGPMEAAAMIVGYENFLKYLKRYPREVHLLLEIVTEFVIRYLQAQEKINGKLRRIVMPDHVASVIGPSYFEEYWLPYTQRVFQEFAYAEIKLWHNEASCQHILRRIPEIGCNVWQFGNDVTKEALPMLENKVVLMGNIDPVAVADYSPERTYQVSKQILQELAPSGIFVLSTAGGVSPSVPVENIRQLLNATMHYSI